MRFSALFSLILNSCASRLAAIFVGPSSLSPSPSPSLPLPRTAGCQSLTDTHLDAARRCRDVYSEAEAEADRATFVESKDTGAQATVTLDGSRAVVCFRGTDSVSDWVSNLNLSKVPFLSRNHREKEREVHSGFFIGHNSVKAKIYAKLNAAIESGKCDRILFTGHSAGATLAAICAFDFRNDKGVNLEVITFGSPKIGNAAFARDFNSKIRCTRIVNDNDAIAHAPLFAGYHHVGGEVIHLRDVAVPEPRPGLIPTLLQLTSWDFIADHDIDSYVSTIEHNLKKIK